MDEQSLIKFLRESKGKGYAAQDESSWIKDANGSTTIKYKSGDWSFQDNYFGGEPYGGRQIVFFKGKPVWINVYYGHVDEKIQNIKEVYSFLKKALLNPREEVPLRGPEEFTEDNYQYRSFLSGNIKNFSLGERISLNGKEIYNATFYGGYVDQRGED